MTGPVHGGGNTMVNKTVSLPKAGQWAGAGWRLAGAHLQAEAAPLMETLGWRAWAEGA